MLSIELKLFNCINMQENQQKWAKSIISTVIAMSTAIATPMSSATSIFISKSAVGVDVAIGFVYCYFYC